MFSTFCWEPFPDLMYFSHRTLRFIHPVIHPWLSPCTDCYHKLLAISTHGPEQLSRHNAAPSLGISTFYFRFYFFFPIWVVPCIFSNYCFLIIFLGLKLLSAERFYLIIVFKQKANASSSVCWLFVLHLILPLIVCVLPSYQCQGRLNTKCFLSRISKQCTLCAWTK